MGNIQIDLAIAEATIILSLIAAEEEKARTGNFSTSFKRDGNKARHELTGLTALENSSSKTLREEFTSDFKSSNQKNSSDQLRLQMAISEAIINCILIHAETEEAKKTQEVEPIRRQMGNRLVWVNKITGQILPRNLIPDIAQRIEEIVGTTKKTILDNIEAILKTDPEKYKKDYTTLLKDGVTVDQLFYQDSSKLDKKDADAISEITQISIKRSRQDERWKKEESRIKEISNQLLTRMKSGEIAQKEYLIESQRILDEYSALLRKSFSDYPSIGDLIKSEIRQLPEQIQKTGESFSASLKSNYEKTIMDVNTSLERSPEDANKVIADIANTSIDIIKENKQTLLSQAGASDKLSEDTFDTVIEVASQEEKISAKIDAVRKKLDDITVEVANDFGVNSTNEKERIVKSASMAAGLVVVAAGISISVILPPVATLGLFVSTNLLLDLFKSAEGDERATVKTAKSLEEAKKFKETLDGKPKGDEKTVVGKKNIAQIIPLVLTSGMIAHEATQRVLDDILKE